MSEVDGKHSSERTTVTYAFSVALAQAVRLRGLSVRRLADLAAVSPATASAALRGKEVQLSSAIRIARVVTQTPVIPELERWSNAVAED